MLIMQILNDLFPYIVWKYPIVHTTSIVKVEAVCIPFWVCVTDWHDAVGTGDVDIIRASF